MIQNCSGQFCFFPRKVPIVATPITIKDLYSGFTLLSVKESVIKTFSSYLDLKHIFFVNSATAAAFIVLKALRMLSEKNEVVLPAYTASSLVIAIKKAGLKPILCDISLSDFNMDREGLKKTVTKRTLAILGVHMFGIVDREILSLKGMFPDVFIIEDCAQSLGSKIKGKYAGNLGDISFFSFNRGKNLPAYGGGCIATSNGLLAEVIEREVAYLREEGLLFKLSIPFKIIALSLVVKPYFYGLLYSLISQFKEKPPPDDFEVRKYTNFQMAVASSLLDKLEELSRKRYFNGMRLIEGLKDLESVLLPLISNDTQPAFNRLPVVFKDLKMRERMENNLGQAGIETSPMYYKPLHHIFDLGYQKSEFPNAIYLAERLLTLPTHPLLAKKDLDKIIEIIHKSK
jgi:dTDP-4-amino-4,6-dideoxygalactose transaminase